ncbi:MAG: hypothetical protein M5U34_42945 [Chloroflexi bacterium]|nr:hypothetical protein [Chloroflexota bacterium]
MNSEQLPLAQPDDAIQLLGQPEIEVSESVITIPLTWQAIGQPAADYTYFIHLSGWRGKRAAGGSVGPTAMFAHQPVA